MRERDMSQVSGERSERVLRELGCYSAVRSYCVLVASQLMRCVAMPFMGRPAFPFIGQGKAPVTVEGKEENEKEKKSSRITGSFFSFTRDLPTLYTSTRTAPCRVPVHHWRHVQASSPGRGAPLRPDERRGGLTRLSVLVRGLGRTAPVHPTLFLM